MRSEECTKQEIIRRVEIARATTGKHVRDTWKFKDKPADIVYQEKVKEMQEDETRTHKTCGTCGVSKVFKMFNKDKQTKDGYMSICKDCKKQNNAKRYK